MPLLNISYDSIPFTCNNNQLKILKKYMHSKIKPILLDYCMVSQDID